MGWMDGWGRSHCLLCFSEFFFPWAKDEIDEVGPLCSIVSGVLWAKMDRS
jgi:hypothetical protein